MTETKTIKGYIFNIQHYSIHDGPGIRTTVFMKGCPLSCLWCQNPESQALQPELFFNNDLCTGCGKCVKACPRDAIKIVKKHSKTKRELCDNCGECAEVCPNEARSMMGRYITAAEVYKDVAADSMFYRRSGGGITLSGGEPLMQPDFTTAILKMCRDDGIHTVLDTCGYAKWETVKKVLKYTDMVLFDFKHMDPKEHKKSTGVSNELILENAKRIYHELHVPMLARVPVIPGYNDSMTNLEATVKFITKELSSSVKIHLLPYHRLGETKYQRLERTSRSNSIQPPDEEYMAKLQKTVERMGLQSYIGG